MDGVTRRNASPAEFSHILSGMACPELESLRKEARELRLTLDEKLRRFRQSLDGSGGSAFSGSRTDYEPFLKHQLSEIAGAIQQHIAKHGCQ